MNDLTHIQTKAIGVYRRKLHDKRRGYCIRLIRCVGAGRRYTEVTWRGTVRRCA
jgi:hypothetical protein